MALVRKVIPDTGVYQHWIDGKPVNEFSARPEINYKRTWRKLESTNRAKAIKEAATTPWVAKADSFKELVKRWQTAGCPGRRRKPKDLRQVDLALPWLLKFFGDFPISEIRLKHVPDYAEWRRKFVKRGTGNRTVDLDLGVLSNVLHYGVKIGVLELNYIYHARDKFQTLDKVRHAYKVSPKSAEIIHQIADYFFDNWKSEVMAFLAFFSEFSGNRHSELLRLDLNARPDEAGYIHWFTPHQIKERTDGIVGQLHLGARSKFGVNPYCDIGPEFAEMIRAFKYWHRKRFGGGRAGKPHPFFVGPQGKVLGPLSFNHALERATRVLKLQHITPHGFRAFFATKHLRDGKRPIEIAFDMGDRTVELVERIYTENVKGPKLWWTPADGLPAWHKWLPPQTGAGVDSLGTKGKIEETRNLHKPQ